MSNTINQLISLEDVTEELVIEYLCTHPEFFTQNEDLLESLQITHPCGPAISLIERQVEILREKNYTLQQEMINTIHIARENAHLFDITKKLTLSLLRVKTHEDFVQTMSECVIKELHADILRIGLRDVPKAISGNRAVFRIKKQDNPVILDLLKGNQSVCKQFAREQRQYLFADQAKEVGSVAIIPLGHQGSLGLLAIGSHDRRRFHREMDTLFLDHIGKVCGEVLAKI